MCEQSREFEGWNIPESKIFTSIKCGQIKRTSRILPSFSNALSTFSSDPFSWSNSLTKNTRAITSSWKFSTKPMPIVTQPQATIMDGSQIYRCQPVTSLVMRTHWRSKLLEKQICRDFKQCIWQEKHHQSKIVLIPNQPKWGLHSKNSRIADVADLVSIDLSDSENFTLDQWMTADTVSLPLEWSSNPSFEWSSSLPLCQKQARRNELRSHKSIHVALFALFPTCCLIQYLVDMVHPSCPIESWFGNRLCWVNK